jgi:glucose/arabinose dehydrogenase
VDSLKGRARHLAVNDNGDIYVKSRFSEKEGRNVALRDTNNDGKADVIETFSQYDRERSYGTAMRVHNGYLYFSSELIVYRQKLTPGKLVPEGEVEEIVVDDHPHGTHEHIAKPICFDNNGNLYVPFGAPSNAHRPLRVSTLVPSWKTMVVFGGLTPTKLVKAKKMVTNLRQV